MSKFPSISRKASSGFCSASVGSYSVSKKCPDGEGEEGTSSPVYNLHGTVFRTGCEHPYASDEPICCRSSSGYRCPRCQPDLAPRAFSLMNEWFNTSKTDDHRVKFRSPFYLSATLCATLVLITPQARASSPLLASAVLLSSVFIVNILLPCVLTKFKSTRAELNALAINIMSGRSMRGDLSFEGDAVQLQYQHKLAWLSVFKDRGGAALYFLCSAGRMWNSFLDGSLNVSHVGIYLPLALLYILRLGLERRGARCTSLLSVAHIFLSCSTIPCSFILKPMKMGAGYGMISGVFEAILTFLVNPTMFMATTCLSLPTVGSLYWEVVALGMSLVVLVPASVTSLVMQFQSTGKVLGFDVGPDLCLPLLAFAVLPLLFSAVLNFYHLVVLERTCLRYFLVGDSGFSFKPKSL